MRTYTLEEVTAAPPQEQKKKRTYSLSEVAGTRAEGANANIGGVDVRGAINALQGPTFSFLDELAGLGSALTGEVANLTPYGDGKSFSENYQSGRDFVRGASQSFSEDYPILAPSTQIAAAAPMFAWNPGAKAQVVGPAQQIWQAGKVGGITGAIQGAGESESDDALGVAKDSLAQGATGSILGGSMNAGTQAIGAVGGNVISRMDDVIQNSNAVPNAVKNYVGGSKSSYAQQKVAEALLRDGKTLSQTEARLRKLGPRAVLADAGGENTKSLLDVLSVLPGETKDDAAKMIRQRVGSRGQKLYDTASNMLSPTGKTLAPTLEALEQQRLVQSKPFYDKLTGMSVRVDGDLKKLLDRSTGNFGEAQRLYRLQTGNDIDLSKINVGDDVPFSVLDTLKQSLYDAGAEAKRNAKTALGGNLDDVRVTLTSKLDDLSPKDKKTGTSIYKMARDAYAGPSQLKDAAELGYSSVNQKAFNVADNVKNLSNSELDAFKIGVLQGIREKVGTQSGQTQLLNMWKEISTQDKLKSLFGGSYRKFAAEVAKEARLKNLESVGKGSQTAERVFGAGDLDVSPLLDTANAARAASTGSPLQFVQSAANLWNRIKTPESVRNEMGSLLLTPQQPAQQLLPTLQTAIDDIYNKRLQRANLVGGWAGLLSPNL